MPRKSRIAEQRRELLPIVSATFAELGYRRTTTAEVAERCGVGENILYRLWPDKKAMFLAALDYVYVASEAIWERILAEDDGASSAFERLLTYEARHHGEHRLYRIVFAGLSETDDADVRAALKSLYGRFHAFVRLRIEEHRGRAGRRHPDAAVAAWAIVGLGTVANIGRELGLLSDTARRKLLADVGSFLVGGPAA